ncbi:hypothetical protein [Formosa sp. PL04]|uniref:hypothetical protein n=1 Tax=Formosa sp. PL04 TaxID=3081755 RepID=UPI002980AC8F|nr:hypothetical protein [Formosa sp. PL04]MDW5290727.1 hypothetical protein [Formosa sp. PL04]
MNQNQIDELKRLAEQKAKATKNSKIESEELIAKMQADEKTFKSNFLGLQNTVFIPSFKEGEKALKSVGKLEYNSNQTTKEFKEQIKHFVKISYLQKGMNNKSLEKYIYFEGLPSNSIVKVTERLKTGNSATNDDIGEFNLTELDKSKIEELIFAFIKKVM